MHRCIRTVDRWCIVSAGPMTGWSWAPAAFRGSFAVPRGAIYYWGSDCRRCPESRPLSTPRNLYANERGGCLHGGKRRLDLIRWWFFNELRRARTWRRVDWLPTRCFGDLIFFICPQNRWNAFRSLKSGIGFSKNASWNNQPTNEFFVSCGFRHRVRLSELTGVG